MLSPVSSVWQFPQEVFFQSQSVQVLLQNRSPSSRISPISLPFRPCSPLKNLNLDSTFENVLYNFLFLCIGVFCLFHWVLDIMPPSQPASAEKTIRKIDIAQVRDGKKKVAADPLRCSLGYWFKYLPLHPNASRWYCSWCGTDPGFSLHRFLSVCRIDWALPNSSTNMVDCTV